MDGSLRKRVAGLSEPPVILGVLNVTPDSFSDGGRYLDVDAAVARAIEMIAQGARIIDVGPESTRPGSDPVPDDEQIRRAVPVVRQIRERAPDVCISIDTQSSAVARAAIQAGADWINDVSALRRDPRMADLAAEGGAPVVLMHMQGTPRTMQQDPQYVDVVSDVIAFLRERMAFAIAAGLRSDRIVLDPGIGFGKTAAHNIEILRRLREVVAIGPPVLVGVSRKSFIGRALGIDDAADRLAGALACTAVAVTAGARVIRTHDVLQTARAAHLSHLLATT